MMCDIVALPSKLYQQAKQLGVKEILLQWQGGSDEGYLEIELDVIKRTKAIEDFDEAVHNWAYEAYHYSGAGDGSSYGDNYIYDIVKSKMRHDEWYMSPHSNEGEETTLSLDADWIESL